MELLSIEQKKNFDQDGFIVVENAVTSSQLAELRSVFSGWFEESRGENKDYGTTLDNRCSFDLQSGHTSEKRRSASRTISGGNLKCFC